MVHLSIGTLGLLAVSSQPYDTSQIQRYVINKSTVLFILHICFYSCIRIELNNEVIQKMIKRSGVDDVVEVTEQRSLVEVVVKFYLA